MRNNWAQKVYNEIIEANSLEDVNRIFNGSRYLTKIEIGAIIGEMIGTYDLSMTDKLKIALTSEKFKENSDCVSEDGEPIINCIIKAYFNNIKNGNTTNKTMLKAFLFDKNINYNWNLKNSKNETPFHVIVDNCEYLKDTDYDLFFKKEIIETINPLTKDINSKNIIQLFKEKNKLKHKNKIKNILKNFYDVVEDQTIYIKEDAYDITENEVE